MSWLTFWRRDSTPDLSEELTECGVDAAKVMYEAHQRALAERNESKAEELLNGLRNFGTRPSASVSQRAQLALALHHALNAAQARGDTTVVGLLTAELVQCLGYAHPRRQAAALFADVQRALTQRQVDDARRGCADIVQQFAASSDPEVRTVVAQALYVRATAQPPDLNEELALYTRILMEFDTGETAALRHCVAATLFNKALRLSGLGLVPASFRTYTELIDRFRSSEEPNVQFQVAMALVNRGSLFATVGHSREELADYEEVIARFHAAPYMDIQRQVAFALCNKSNALDRSGRFSEADETRTRLFAHFAYTCDPGIQNAVATALGGRAAIAGQSTSTWD